MIDLDRAASEECRLKDLREFDVLDTPPDHNLDRITQIARMMFKVPIAYISFVDSDRQWMKSRVGIDVLETPREIAFCNYTIQQDAPLVIDDTLLDHRFSDHPLVIGEPKIRFYAGAPLISKRGNRLGSFCIVDRKPGSLTADQRTILQSLAAMVMDDLELRQLAGTDSLTGAMTRRAFDEAAAKAIFQAQRKGTATSFLQLDLDHFKKINDRFGHSTGDQVLVETVKTCFSSLRNYDFVGRRGGEEFAILMTDTSSQTAAQIAERLRLGIADLRFQSGGESFSISASIGLTQWSEADRSIADALTRADSALYRAKAEGRNRVVVEEAPTASLSEIHAA